jgi:GNAT superfamily N-acetyltransferase
LETQLFSIEERVAIMNTEAYLPELDLVVKAPDGSLAGNCICGSEHAESEIDEARGYTDPVVVHPIHQRQGIARALLLEGLARLRERGMRVAGLGTTNLNAGMRKAAEAVGFQCVSHNAWYSKQIE